MHLEILVIAHHLTILTCIFSLASNVTVWISIYLSTYGVLECLHVALQYNRSVPEYGNWVNLFRQLEGMVEWTQRCTWRPYWSKVRDALWGYYHWNPEMHLNATIKWVWVMKLEAIIEWNWWYTKGPWWCALGDAHGGHDHVSQKMQLKADILRIERCRGRLWLNKLRRWTWRLWLT